MDFDIISEYLSGKQEVNFNKSAPYHLVLLHELDTEDESNDFKHVSLAIVENRNPKEGA